MSTENRFRLNQETATGKVIDGEAVLINVVTGRYYSLSDASCVAWTRLSRGASPEEVATAITDRYDVAAEIVNDELAALVGELLEEDLLTPGAPADAAGSTDEDLHPSVNGSRLPYTPLRLETFRDMEDLLAFDPPLPQAPEQLSQAS